MPLQIDGWWLKKDTARKHNSKISEKKKSRCNHKQIRTRLQTKPSRPPFSRSEPNQNVFENCAFLGLRAARGRCAACEGGSLVSGETFAPAGLSESNGRFAQGREVDEGRLMACDGGFLGRFTLFCFVFFRFGLFARGVGSLLRDLLAKTWRVYLSQELDLPKPSQPPIQKTSNTLANATFHPQPNSCKEVPKRLDSNHTSGHSPKQVAKEPLFLRASRELRLQHRSLHWPSPTTSGFRNPPRPCWKRCWSWDRNCPLGCRSGKQEKPGVGDTGVCRFREVCVVLTYIFLLRFGNEVFVYSRDAIGKPSLDMVTHGSRHRSWIGWCFSKGSTSKERSLHFHSLLFIGLGVLGGCIDARCEAAESFGWSLQGGLLGIAFGHRAPGGGPVKPGWLPAGWMGGLW